MFLFLSACSTSTPVSISAVRAVPSDEARIELKDTEARLVHEALTLEVELQTNDPATPGRASLPLNLIAPEIELVDGEAVYATALSGDHRVPVVNADGRFTAELVLPLEVAFSSGTAERLRAKCGTKVEYRFKSGYGSPGILESGWYIPYKAGVTFDPKPPLSARVDCL